MTKFWTKGYHYCDVSTILSTSSSPSHHPRGKCPLAKGDECSTLGTVEPQDRGGRVPPTVGPPNWPQILGGKRNTFTCLCVCVLSHSVMSNFCDPVDCGSSQNFTLMMSSPQYPCCLSRTPSRPVPLCIFILPHGAPRGGHAEEAGRQPAFAAPA